MTQEPKDSKIEKWIHALSRAFNYASGAVLLIMMIFISSDIIARYLFNHAIAGSIDFIVVMMVLFVFPSLANVTRRRGHVRTDIVYDALPRRIRGLFDCISLLFGLCFMILLAWQLGARAWNFIQYPPGTTTDYFQWPHYPFLIIAMLGSFLMCLELLLWLIESFKLTAKR